MMIALVLWGLAAACNAVMDTLSHHYYQSIFSGLKNSYWNPADSWKNKYIDRDPKRGMRKIWLFDYPTFLTDGWHLFKSLMIFCLCGSASILYVGSREYLLLATEFPIITGAVLFVSLGTLWNIIFSLFYNRILKRK